MLGLVEDNGLRVFEMLVLEGGEMIVAWFCDIGRSGGYSVVETLGCVGKGCVHGLSHCVGVG